MAQIQTEVSRTIPATIPTVYAILTDYRNGHRRILPSRYFKSMAVLRGGRGAGTLVRVEMSLFGARRVFTMMVREPEPGRVLVEVDRDANVTTTFTLEPSRDGRATDVSIASEMPASRGFKGFLERILNPILIGHIYRQQLKLLTNYASKRVGRQSFKEEHSLNQPAPQVEWLGKPLPTEARHNRRTK